MAERKLTYSLLKAWLVKKGACTDGKNWLDRHKGKTPKQLWEALPYHFSKWIRTELNVAWMAPLAEVKEALLKEIPTAAAIKKEKNRVNKLRKDITTWKRQITPLLNKGLKLTATYSEVWNALNDILSEDPESIITAIEEERRQDNDY